MGSTLGIVPASNGPSLADGHFDSGDFLPLPCHRSMAKVSALETVIYTYQFKV